MVSVAEAGRLAGAVQICAKPRAGGRQPGSGPRSRNAPGRIRQPPQTLTAYPRKAAAYQGNPGYPAVTGEMAMDDIIEPENLGGFLLPGSAAALMYQVAAG
jgi:hypothetical protein